MSRLIMPDQLHTPDGKIRRVGVEMEMAGLELATIAEAVTAVFDGQAKAESPFEIKVQGTRHGSFLVELDASLLKDREYRPYLATIGIDPDDVQGQQVDDLIARLARSVVPSEVVAPPIPMTALEEMDTLRAKLHQAGAKGTRAALVYAFGVQFNVEVASFEAAYLRDMLRAYVLLHDRLSKRGTVDLARKISPYIRPFPGGYARVILAEDYVPTQTELIQDYLQHNPTRNRPLDMLPLFAHLDEDRVLSAPVEAHLIKPRPAFHYRLPNSQIDEPKWSLAMPWNDWVMVEKLAQDKDRLATYSRAYLEQPGEVIAGMIDDWVDMLGSWFKP